MFVIDYLEQKTSKMLDEWRIMLVSYIQIFTDIA